MRRLLGLFLSSMIALGTIVPSPTLLANEVKNVEPATEIITEANENEQNVTGEVESEDVDRDVEATLENDE